MSDAPKQIQLNYPEIDFDFMPDLACKLINNLSKQHQIDPVIPFAIILGAVATATGGKIATMINESWIQHPSLYLCPIAETADGKSQILNKLHQPLIDAESRMQADAKIHYRMQAARREIAQANLKSIKDSKSTHKSKSKQTPASDADLAAAIDAVANSEPDPIPLILVGGDTTPDRLLELLQMHKSLGILDAEGTLFNHLSGRKHNTGDSYETILAAFTGDVIKSHRIGRGDSFVAKPHLIICAAVQPTVWLNLATDLNASNRGVVGRFIPLVAKSDRGFRDVYSIDKYSTDQALMDRWENLIVQLINNKSERTLRLSPESYKLFQQTRAKWERKLIDPDVFLNGFGSRLMGNLITAAMLFTLMINPAEDQFIHDDALEMALALADAFTAHRRLSDDLQIERSPELRILDKLAQWMDEQDAAKAGGLGVPNRQYKFGIRDLQQNMKGQRWVKDGGIDAIKTALSNLENKCWLDFEGDHHIITHKDLREHHRNQFRATKMPAVGENATKLPA